MGLEYAASEMYLDVLYENHACKINKNDSISIKIENKLVEK